MVAKTGHGRGVRWKLAGKAARLYREFLVLGRNFDYWSYDCLTENIYME